MVAKIVPPEQDPVEKTGKKPLVRLRKPRNIGDYNALGRLFAAPDRRIREAELRYKQAKSELDQQHAEEIADDVAERDRVGKFFMKHALADRETVFGSKMSAEIADVKATIHNDTLGTFTVSDLTTLAQELEGIPELCDLVTVATQQVYIVDTDTLKDRLKTDPSLRAKVTKAVLTFKSKFKLETPLSTSEQQLKVKKQVWEQPMLTDEP